MSDDGSESGGDDGESGGDTDDSPGLIRALDAVADTADRAARRNEQALAADA